MKTLTKFYLMLRNRKGATMAEYAVVVVLIILIALIAFTALGANILAAINEVAAAVAGRG